MKWEEVVEIIKKSSLYNGAVNNCVEGGYPECFAGNDAKGLAYAIMKYAEAGMVTEEVLRALRTGFGRC